MTATLGITEDQIFDAVWQTVTQFFDSTVTPYIFKGFQNSTAVPAGVSYIVISPGTRTTQGQGLRDYDTTNQLQVVGAHRTYDYQVDCFGANGPIWADLISAAWKSPWVVDYTTLNTLPFTPLYADEAQQLNIVNSEDRYEQRFMTKLYIQVNQSVALPQDFFTSPTPLVIHPPADNLAP